MESYRKYNSKHYYSSRHINHGRIKANQNFRFGSHFALQRHHNYRSNDDGEYEYNNRVPSMYCQPIRRLASPLRSPPPAVPIVEKPRERNWKLIADPFFGQVTTKVYRYDGIVPNVSEVFIQDPRTYNSKNHITSLPIELPVPVYTLDNSSNDQCPDVEVTFSNLNDSIDTVFLTDLLVKFGKVELIQIFNHPVTKKHLGLAKIIFEHAVSAKFCVQRLNKTPLMGKVVNVFLDPFATQCKMMFDKMTEESNIKLFSTSNQDQESVKSKEHFVKSQNEEKSHPSTDTNYINDNNYDHLCDISHSPDSQDTSDLPIEQSYCSEDNSIEGNPVNEGIQLNPHNRCVLETGPVASQLPSTPPAPNVNTVAQNKLNLDARIGMLLNKKRPCVEPEVLSILKQEPDDLPDNNDIDIIDDDINLNLNVQSGVYDKCIETTAEHLKTNRKNEKLEANSFLRNVMNNTMHEPESESLRSDICFNNKEAMLRKCPKEKNPNDKMSLFSLSSHDEKIILENDPNVTLPQYSPLHNYSPHGYYYPTQSNNNGYQYYSSPPSYPSGPSLVKTGFYKQKPSQDRHEKNNLPSELRKNLMTRVMKELRIRIKCDLMKKMRTNVAFNVLDQWWEEAEKQSKNKKKELSLKKPSKQQNNRCDQEEMVLTSENDEKYIGDDKVTRPTFAEQKCFVRELFDCDSSTSTSELSVHSSFDEEVFSNDSSTNGFKLQKQLNKLCKSMTMEDFDRVREMTPTGNETPMAIDNLSSTDEEGSFIKYKHDKKNIRHKIKNGNLDLPVESKKHLLNGEFTTTKVDTSTEFADNSDYLSPKQVSIWESEVDTKDKCITSQPVVNKQKISECLPKKFKQPLTVRDSNKIENIDQSTVQKYCDIQVEIKNCKRRNMVKEAAVQYEFFTKGIDVEDINYLKQSYQSMLTNDTVHYFWLNETHWANHPVTAIPNEPSQKNKKDKWKIHETGCARTEGYYKMDSMQKANYKYNCGHTVGQLNRITELKHVQESTGKILAMSRKARNNQRRSSTVFGTTSKSDLLKFNVLQFCKKKIKFGKSSIHDWGLFAMESIAAGEMIIEYVGQMIRPIVADLRERQYEATGIGSSYLFRIDLDTIIDATKCGNLSRFINHSCNPNCYAKVIQIDGHKKIVIFSKQLILVNEEITYDYKFPLEENKIPCLCDTYCCRGTLN